MYRAVKLKPKSPARSRALSTSCYCTIMYLVSSSVSQPISFSNNININISIFSNMISNLHTHKLFNILYHIHTLTVCVLLINFYLWIISTQSRQRDFKTARKKDFLIYHSPFQVPIHQYSQLQTYLTKHEAWLTNISEGVLGFLGFARHRSRILVYTDCGPCTSTRSRVCKPCNVQSVIKVRLV